MNLALACGIAFAAVFLLLTVLAALMQAITRLLPVRPERSTGDPTLTAAIATTVATLMQGARVTRIEEEP